MANLSEALASKITGSIKGAAGNFLGGVKGSFIGANPAVFAPVVAGLQKAFESQTKEIKKDREERKREKAFDEEKNNEQRKLFTDILGQLKEINDTLKNLLKAFTSKDKSPWKEMLAGLAALLSKFLEDLNGKLGKFLDFLADIFRGLKTGLDDLGKLLSKLFDDLKSFFERIKFPSLDDIFKSLKFSFDDLARGLKLFFDDLKNLFGKIKTPDFLNDIFKSLKLSFDEIGKGLKLFFDDLKNLFGTIKTPDFLNDIFKTLRASLDEIGRGLRLFFDDFKNIFKKGVDDLSKFLRLDDLADAFRKFKNNFLINLSVIGDELADLGKLIKEEFLKFSSRFAGKLDDVVKAVDVADAASDTAKVAKSVGILGTILSVFKGLGNLNLSAFKWASELMDVAPLVRSISKVAVPLSVMISLFDGISNALFNDKKLADLLGKKGPEYLTIGDRLSAFAGGFLGSFFGIVDLLLNLMDIDLGEEVSEDMMGNMMGGKKRTVQGMVTDFLTKNISVVFNALKSMLVFFGQVLTSESAMALYTKVGEVIGAVTKGFSKFIDFMKDFLFSDTMMKVYDVLLAGLKTTGQNAAAAFMGVLDIIIGIITFDTAKMMKGVGSVQDAVVAQVKNLAGAVVDITKLMFGFIEDGVNWLIMQLPPVFRPKTPFDLTGRYALNAVDSMDASLGAAMTNEMSGSMARARAALTSGQPLNAGNIGYIRQAYGEFSADRKKRGLPFVNLEDFEEAVKNGTLDALHTRRSPSAMDLWGQNAQYSKDQYFLSRDYYRNDESYRQERAQLQDQFNNNMIQMYRQAFSKMVGPMGFGGQTSRAGYNIANQPGIVEGFIRGGTKIFGDQMGAPMAYIFNSLAGNYLDQFINNTMAPALGMKAGQLNRSINNLIASRQFRPQMKQVERELANSRNELVKLEKESGFSMAELIKAGAAGGFDANQQQRYGALVSLRQQISQRETIYKSLKDQEKKYKDMALEDIIFGLSGVPTGIRSFLGYEQGLNQLAISLGMASASPFAPIFGTTGAAGMGGMYGGMRGFGGIGGGTMIGMPGGGMMAPSTIYGYPMMTSGGFNPYAPMGGMGGVPYGPYYSGPSQMPFMATFPGEQDILALESGMAGTPSAMSRLSRSMPAMVPLLSYALTRQLGNKIGVKGLLGNMAMMNVASPVISSLLGSLQMFGGKGLSSFSLTGSLSNALGLKGITGASTMGEIGMGVAGSVNNLLGGGMIPGLAKLLTSGGSSLMSSALAQGAFGPAGFTSLGGQLGAGMANFGAGMSMGTGSLSGFSGAMSTGGATAGGALAGSLLGGFSSYGIAEGLSGGYSINKNFNKLAGAVAMIPGLTPFAPLIGLGAAALNRLFGMKAKEYTDYGIRGTLGEDATSLEQYKDWFQKGGRYRSDRSGTEVSAVDQESLNAIGGAISSRNELVRSYGQILGYGDDAAQKTRNFTQQISMSLKGLDEAGMAKAFGDMITSFSNGMIQTVYAGVEKFKFANEELIQTMANLANSTIIFDDAMFKLGFTADKLSETFRSKTLADLAGFKQSLIGTFGGDTLDQQRENFSRVVGTYFDIMYTETEKNMYIMESNRKRMAQETEKIVSGFQGTELFKQVEGLQEFSKVLTGEGVIDVEATLRKNYDTFRGVVESLNKKDTSMGFKLMDFADEFDNALKAFINLEVEKQEKAKETEQVVSDLVAPFANYVGEVASSIEFTGEYGTANFGGLAQTYVDSPTYTPYFSSQPSTQVSSGTSGASGEFLVTGGYTGTTNQGGSAAGGSTNPLYIDNSVNASTSSPTAIIMNDDKVRDYHPILNSNDRNLTNGFFLARV